MRHKKALSSHAVNMIGFYRRGLARSSQRAAGATTDDSAHPVSGKEAREFTVTHVSSLKQIREHDRRETWTQKSMTRASAR
jgi:hypothetical protein